MFLDEIRQAFSLGTLQPRGMASGKPFSVWLSGELLEFAEKRAGKHPSDYLRELIERDRAGRASTSAPDDEILVALARRFHPTVSEALAQQLQISPRNRAVNQARAL